MRWPIVGLVALVACTSHISQSALERRVTIATLSGWAAMDLPDPGENCHVERLQVEFPDAAGFARICAPATADTAHACFKWRMRHDGRRAVGVYPAAIISPDEPPEVVEELAVHELAHGLVACSLGRTLDDPYDYEHTDERVWGFGVDTVERVAWEALKEGI